SPRIVRIDLQLKLYPGGEGRAHRLRRRRVHMHRTIMAQAHPLGDAARDVFVGFDGARGQEALGMARLNAHDRYARLAKSPVQPFRQRTGLDPSAIDNTGPLCPAFDTWLRLPRY